MFGVPISGPTYALCDNASAVKNTSVPENTLSKKHTLINYHPVREAAAGGNICVGKEDSEMKLVNVLTKFPMHTNTYVLVPSELEVLLRT
eukprot:7961994-Ditylum_brightwellii.AAC.1